MGGAVAVSSCGKWNSLALTSESKLPICSDDVHLAEVQADFGEGGDAGGSVVSPTVTVFSSGAVGRTLGGVVEPEAKDLRKILPFSRRQGDVLLWSLCLHSCTVDLECFSLNIENVFAVWKGAVQAVDVLTARGQMAAWISADFSGFWHGIYRTPIAFLTIC